MLMEEKDKELLAEIGGLLQESASSVLPMLLPKETEVAVEEMGEWMPTAYPESMVLVTATFTEGPSGSVYFVLSAKVVSVLVDLMLGGAGAADREINEELKDALKEVINQVLGVTASSLRERYEGLATFSQVEVHALEPNIDLNLLLGDEKLFRVVLALKFGGSPGGSAAVCIPEETLKSLREDLIEADAAALAKAAAKRTEEDPVAAAMAETAAEAKQQARKQEARVEVPLVAAPGNVGIILDIELPIVIRLGTAEMTLQEIVRLGPGSLIELNKGVDEPVELLVNNKMIARGEVVVVEGNFAFRVTDIESKLTRIQSLG
jgi:flagellar motor switch protein FliN/FliY